jgi:hypothetical protein
MWKAPWRITVSVALLGWATWAACLAPRAAAQEESFPPLFGPDPEASTARTRARAVLMLSAPGPLERVVLGTALFFTPRRVERDKPPKVDKAQPLGADMTEGVRDSTPLPTRWHENTDEQRAFSNVLYAASQLSADAFRRGARHDLTYAHVIEQPSRYRGEVVHVEGTLKQLRRYDPPWTAKQAGVANLYEGWIFDKHYGARPWCVVFTELPPGLEVGDGLEVAVSTDGYLFKRYRYKSRGKSKGKLPEAPLLIGRTLTLPAAVADTRDAETEWMKELLPVFLVLLGASMAVAVGLGLWYRRGDRKVHARLEEAAARRPFVLPEPEPDTRLEQRQPEN